MHRILLIGLLVTITFVSAYAADTVVTQSNTSFNVSELLIKSGDSITFNNKDDVTHNIQITDGEGNNEDEGLQRPGEKTQQVFTAPGEYKVQCSIHPKMKMKVTVE